jgi:hypothetical protein
MTESTVRGGHRAVGYLPRRPRLDTFAHWAGMRREAEKDAGAVLAAWQSLESATRRGLAVALVAHQRKGGGEDGEGIRGSGGIAGAADALVELERPTGSSSPRQRQIVAVSRWPGATPPLLLVDYREHAWRVLGEADGRRQIVDPDAAAKRAVRMEEDVLAFIAANSPTSKRAVRGAIEARASDTDNALSVLEARGLVKRSANGLEACPDPPDTLGHAISESSGDGVSRDGHPPVGGVPRDTPQALECPTGGTGTPTEEIDHDGSLTAALHERLAARA